MVRFPARVGARADFQRQLYRRCSVAAGLRARDGAFRLATDDAVIRRAGDRRDGAAGRVVLRPSARTAGNADSSRLGVRETAGPRLAAEFGLCAVGGGELSLLRADGDPAGASDCVL